MVEVCAGAGVGSSAIAQESTIVAQNGMVLGCTTGVRVVASRWGQRSARRRDGQGWSRRRSAVRRPYRRVGRPGYTQIVMLRKVRCIPTAVKKGEPRAAPAAVRSAPATESVLQLWRRAPPTTLVRSVAGSRSRPSWPVVDVPPAIGASGATAKEAPTLNTRTIDAIAENLVMSSGPFGCRGLGVARWWRPLSAALEPPMDQDGIGAAPFVSATSVRAGQGRVLALL